LKIAETLQNKENAKVTN